MFANSSNNSNLHNSGFNDAASSMAAANSDDDDNLPEGKLIIDLNPAGVGAAVGVEPADVANSADKLSSYQSTAGGASGSSYHQQRSGGGIKQQRHVTETTAAPPGDVNNSSRQHSSSLIVPPPVANSNESSQHSDCGTNSRPASNSSATCATDAATTLRMKIKRKKMATRQSAARHEIQLAAKAAEEYQDLLPATSTTDTNDTVESCRENNKLDLCKTPPPNLKKSAIGDEKLERRDVGTWVRTIGSATDAESFGPCEPGSAVTLEGIVWHETTGGILVVNVTWRGKSYVGTLMDCTKSDWAAPRFCESPNNDNVLDGSKTPAKGRGLKRCAGSSASLAAASRSNTAAAAAAATTAAAAAANDASNAQQKSTQNSKEKDAGDSGSGVVGLTDSLETPAAVTTTTTAAPPSVAKNEPILEPASPTLLECPWSGCDKKYVHVTAVKYHQNSIHFRDKPKLKTVAKKSANAAAAKSAVISTTTSAVVVVDNSKLSEAENESLENLFKVVESSGGGKSAPPQLPLADAASAAGNVAGNFSTGVYSDVSDDDEEAPKLERHNNASTKAAAAVATAATKAAAEHQPQPPQQPSSAAVVTSSIAATAVVIAQPIVSVPPTVVMPTTCSASIGSSGGSNFVVKTSDLKNLAGKSTTTNNVTELGKNNAKKVNTVVPQKHVPPAVIKKEPPSTSPKAPPAEKKMTAAPPPPPHHHHMQQPPSSAAASYMTQSAANVLNAHHPYAAFGFPGGPPPTFAAAAAAGFDPSGGAPSFFLGGQQVFALPLGGAGVPPQFYFNVSAPLIQHQAAPPQPLPPPSGGSSMHKIHELSDASTAASNAAKLAVSPSAVKNNLTGNNTGESTKIVADPTVGAPPDAKIRRLNEPVAGSGVGGSSTPIAETGGAATNDRSPPFHRHFHEHHHHYPPVLPTSLEYATAAYQQAAAAGMVGTIPPYGRK